MMFTLFLYTTMAGFLISPLIRKAGYESALALVLGAFMGLFLGGGALLLARTRPEESFVRFGGEIVGKWLHYPLCAVMIFFLLNTAGQIFRLFTDFLIQTYLPETPDWALTAVFGVCVAIGVRTGLESIFRFSQLFFWFVLLSGLVGTSLLGKGIPTFRAHALLNHFDPAQLWGGAYLSAGNYAELFLILLLYPQLANGRRTGRTMFWATLSSLVAVLSNLIPTLMLFDTKLAGNMTYPVLEAVRFIRVADFLENLDPLLTSIWIFSLFIKLSLLVYAATLIFSQLVKLKDHRPLSFSLTAFAVVLSFHLGRNFTEVENYMEHAFSTFSLLMGSLPLLYLAVWLVRRRKGNAKKASGLSSE
ncbi:GerAB/ArcD/ProY family transporter [Paenibacillus aurantius]|uniref:GerAB/ArcD/ProY family transporter n=2 Tax=Paenibacillus aurantius TaxID=2918900 RepID=A0AA96LF98_9BACL|nr:GerAB/ArcD/ProY family transporter [Paenibacillus aurantius]WNQ12094.1 GerAB/ArcD/ProY family transporter [Paenibacillus aurantius]